MKTVKLNTIIDQNLVFHSIGFGDPIGSLANTQVTIDTVNSQDKAGEFGTYLFDFECDNELPEDSVVKITFPSIYDVSGLASSSCSCNLYSDISCDGNITEVNIYLLDTVPEEVPI